jgi:hypothetical protein
LSVSCLPSSGLAPATTGVALSVTRTSLSVTRTSLSVTLPATRRRSYATRTALICDSDGPRLAPRRSGERWCTIRHAPPRYPPPVPPPLAAVPPPSAPAPPPSAAVAASDTPTTLSPPPLSLGSGRQRQRGEDLAGAGCCSPGGPSVMMKVYMPVCRWARGRGAGWCCPRGSCGRSRRSSRWRQRRRSPYRAATRSGSAEWRDSFYDAKVCWRGFVEGIVCAGRH